MKLKGNSAVNGVLVYFTKNGSSDVKNQGKQDFFGLSLSERRCVQRTCGGNP